jgi:hypothetical protein
MILCLPVYPGDLDMGMELLKLWADLEDTFNPNIAVAIVLRFDMNPSTDIPKDVLAHVEKKFKIYIHRSKRKGVGWPAGCNGIELGAYEWFVEMNRGNTDFNYDYILIAEADTVPLRKGWADEIRNEAYEANALILGAYLRRPDCWCEHINGNCVMHKNFWQSCRTLFTCPDKIGWDAYIGHTAISVGTPSRLIWQDYRLGAPDNPWKGDDFIFEPKFYKSDRTPLYGKPVYPAMFHGMKTMQGIDAVRKRLLSK